LQKISAILQNKFYESRFLKTNGSGSINRKKQNFHFAVSKMNIFVYGTLLRCLERESALVSSRYLGPAVIQSQLFDFEYYPGIKDGQGIVIGELYECSPETVQTLDQIEGFNAGNIKTSLFVRKNTEALKFADGELLPDVYCYFYNRSTKGTRIYHGDYRRYLLEKENQDQWILAYGSNMSSKRLQERVGKIKDFKKGYVEGFGLVFNKKPHRKQGAYANIAFKDGQRCPAVAYQLFVDQIQTIDLHEGVPRHYLRISVPFLDESGNQSLVQAYIAHPDKLIWEMEPEPEYMNHIQQGYEEHGFCVNTDKERGRR